MNGENTPDVQTVRSAGLITLWPLLPDLLRQLGLSDKGRFVSANAQREAACYLDWVVWNSDAEHDRLRFPRFLCGLNLDDEADADVDAAANQHTSFEPEPEKQMLVEHWIAQLPRQLPGWRTLKATDVRTLFLQRPGSLCLPPAAAPVLTIDQQPFDVLLGEWPWPLSSLMLPWLSSPLDIRWPIPPFEAHSTFTAG